MSKSKPKPIPQKAFDQSSQTRDVVEPKDSPLIEDQSLLDLIDEPSDEPSPVLGKMRKFQ